jgi:hypothetical protein
MSGQRLTEAIRPANVLDGRTIHVKFLVTKRHPDLLYDPDTDTDPVPDSTRFPSSLSFRQQVIAPFPAISTFGKIVGRSG